MKCELPDYLSEPHPPGVLVADDEREIRDALEWGLQREGFSVWSAADGQQAIDLYRQHHASIDAVLLDIHMPRLEGPAVWATIRKLKPGVKCCFMTGDLETQHPAALGAHALVAKPFHIPDVAELLRTLIEGRQPTVQIAAATKFSESSL